MIPHHRAPARLLTLLLPLLLTPGASGQRADDASAPRARQGGLFGGGWTAPWQHRHTNRRGTPFIHPFGHEPAFLGRDLLLDYRHAKAGDEREDELELELEWALTGRLGFTFEAPLVRVDPSPGASHAGIGDLAVVPRALLVDQDTFLLAVNLEIAAPTGDDRRGLGAGEAVLGPSLACWVDLGGMFTLQAGIGTEHGLESGDAELSYHGVLTWSTTVQGDHRGDHGHVRPGLLSGIAEFSGRTILDGADRDRTTGELLLGVCYSLNGLWDVRAGYEFPLGGPQDIDHGLVFGLIRHF